MRADEDRPVTAPRRRAGTLNLLPRAYIGGMLKHIDFLASNASTPFGPTIGAALNITVMSYCGTCFVGINVDAGAVPDPDLLMDCLRDGFDEVLAVEVRRRLVLPTPRMPPRSGERAASVVRWVTLRSGRGP